MNRVFFGSSSLFNNPAKVLHRARVVFPRVFLKRFRCTEAAPKQKGSTSGLWSWVEAYTKRLETHPLSTKAISSGFLVGLGDGLTQIFIEPDRDFDFRRIGSMTFLGTFLLAPTLHMWYGSLGSIVARFIPPTVGRFGDAGGIKGVLAKLCLDQFAFAPVFVGVFISAIMTLEGRMSEIGTVLANDWSKTVCVNWLVWIPSQIVMFSVVPLHLQVLWANGVGLIWNCYLSYASHQEHDEVDGETTAVAGNKDSEVTLA